MPLFNGAAWLAFFDKRLITVECRRWTFQRARYTGWLPDYVGYAQRGRCPVGGDWRHALSEKRHVLGSLPWWLREADGAFSRCSRSHDDR